MNPCPAMGLALLCLNFFTSYAPGAELQGKITALQDGRIRIALEGGLHPQPGDPVRITWTLGERVLDAGKAEVVEVGEGFAMAKVLEGNPNINMQAVIESAAPQRAASGAEPSDPDLDKGLERKEGVVLPDAKQLPDGKPDPPTAGASGRLAYLGVYTLDHDSYQAHRLFRPADPSGIYVELAVPGSPAEEAGLRRGDGIEELDGEPVRNSFWFTERIRSKRPGEQVALRVNRKEGATTLIATLGEGLEPEKAGLPGIMVKAGGSREEEARQALRVFHSYEYEDYARVWKVYLEGPHRALDGVKAVTYRLPPRLDQSWLVGEGSVRRTKARQEKFAIKGQPWHGFVIEIEIEYWQGALETRGYYMELPTPWSTGGGI